MADFTLTAAPILGGIDVQIGSCTLKEHDDLALVSVATPLKGDTALKKALKAAFKLEVPGPTMTTTAGEMRAVRTTADQMLLIFPHATPDADPFVQGKLKGAGYTTDQTDVWVVLELAGPGALAALERLCPLDLADAAFPVGASGRTVMEHMGALIIRTGDDAYLLASASSSAGSFLHAVETSLSWTS